VSQLPPAPTRARRAPEALFAREMLHAIGQLPDVAMYPNESGAGYTGSVAADLARELARWPEAVRVAASVLARHRIRWGMGVGSPDNFGAVAGYALGIETKSMRGVLSPAQVDWHAAARARGVRVIVPRTVEEVLRAIEVVRGGGVP